MNCTNLPAHSHVSQAQHDMQTPASAAGVRRSGLPWLLQSAETSLDRGEPLRDIVAEMFAELGDVDGWP